MTIMILILVAVTALLAATAFPPLSRTIAAIVLAIFASLLAIAFWYITIPALVLAYVLLPMRSRNDDID